MTVKMCERGDYQPAVGTGRRPVRWCRNHYLEECGAEFVKAEVIGEVPVTDVRTNDEVQRGGVVELDPQEIYVEQLVYAGVIRVLPAEDRTAESAKPAAKRS